MIYLDNAATTKPSGEVIDAVRRAMEEIQGNPSSLHLLGAGASRAVEEARGIVGRAIGVRSQDIIFTSGGTESNNLAIRGAAMTSRGKHLITTEIEHPSVYQVFQDLEDEGFSVDYLGVDGSGVVRIEDVKKALREDTALASVMLVNNEIGSIQPIREIRSILGKSVTLHVDAVQALGKMPFSAAGLGADMVTVSGHKIHGPKGVGALYKSPRVRLKPLVIGGEQEGKLRAGTENVPAIVGFGVAVRAASSSIKEARSIEALRLRLAEGLSAIPGSRMNGSREGSAPHIVNFSFSRVPGEILLHHLSARGVFVSTRAACSSRRKSPSRVLKALGLSEDEAEGAIRFGLSMYTTAEEIDSAIAAVRGAVNDIRSL